jgi:hypothetical protein
MRYRIILVKNKSKKKVLVKSNSFEFINNTFRDLRKNNKPDMPQKYLNYKDIIPVEYEILLIKERTETDENRIVRDKLGKLTEEKSDSSKWVIIDSAPYQQEETFWVYGYDSRFERFTVRDIIKKILMKGIRSKNGTKEIVIVKNKLIIRGDDLDFIICKCPDDCLRLHNKLKEIAKDSKTSKLLFLGIASDKTCGDMYDLIEAKTGWNKTKIWRTTTRP